MVGIGGFEPPTPASRRRCSTRLSYIPALRARLYISWQIAARQRPAAEGNKVQLYLPSVGELQAHPGLSMSRPPPAFGVSPSGKASVFGTDIPRFESWYPSHSSRLYAGARSERRRASIWRGAERPIFRRSHKAVISPRFFVL